MDKNVVGKDELVEAVNQRCSVNKVFIKISQISLKIPVLESLFNEVQGIDTCNVIKELLQLKCFPVNLARF